MSPSLPSILILLSAFFSFASAGDDYSIGFDTSDSIQREDLECLRSINRASFAIYEVWNNYYNFIGIQNIKNALAAGYTSDKVDAYMKLCVEGCAYGSNQIEVIINKLHTENASIGRLWIDIQSYDFGKNMTTNRQFLLDMVKKATLMKMPVGVRTSLSEWNYTVGKEWKGLADVPLWWHDQNGRQDMDEFVPFGGWTVPTLHLFAAEHNLKCFVEINASVKRASTS